MDDGEILARATAVGDFFGKALRRDALDDWNLAKELGELLIRIEQDSNSDLMGRVLLVRARRHLGSAAEAIAALRDCRERISSRELKQWEQELLVPVLAQEEQFLNESFRT